MALSFCSNWGSLEHHFDPEYISNFQQTQTELLNFDCNSALADTCVDPVLLQPDQFFYADNYSNQLPSDYLISSTSNYSNQLPSDYLISLSQEIFPLDELHYLSNFTPGFFDGCSTNPGLVPAPLLPEVVDTLPETGYGESIVKKESLSAQSIAARERRRKITAKTQELGKRIPGGNKMNTADMFQAAFKYVKYLQAQVAILETMGSIQMLETKELQVLVASPIIQEKLYSKEKCLVPKEFLQTLPNPHELIEFQ